MTGPVTMTTKSQRKVLNRRERLLKAGDSEGQSVIGHCQGQKPTLSMPREHSKTFLLLCRLHHLLFTFVEKGATAWIATQFDCLQILSLLLNMQLLQCYIFVLFSVSLT